MLQAVSLLRASLNSLPIALYTLIVTGAAGESRTLCMRRGKSVLSEGAGYFTAELPPIVLGTMALRGVYAVFDMDSGRVGLASKQGLTVNSKNCAAPVQVTAAVVLFAVGVEPAYICSACCDGSVLS
jgi:ABC-type spermidine/putrescine transport system permease subunit II